MTGNAWRLRPLAAEHTRGLAECHIECWREAYRGLVPDHVLDAFDLDGRAEMWENRRVRYPGATTVALHGDTVIGFASAGAPLDERPVAERALYALYVRAAWYGTGVAHDLMRAALDPTVDTYLWVFEENPRALAFYRKYGFALDGARRAEAFTVAWEVRMVRPATATLSSGR